MCWQLILVMCMQDAVEQAIDETVISGLIKDSLSRNERWELAQQAAQAAYDAALARVLFISGGSVRRIKRGERRKAEPKRFSEFLAEYEKGAEFIAEVESAIACVRAKAEGKPKKVTMSAVATKLGLGTANTTNGNDTGITILKRKLEAAARNNRKGAEIFKALVERRVGEKEKN